MTFFSRKKILIQAVTFFPSFILITFAALFSFKLWNNVIASPSTPPSTPPVISPETPPGYILGSPYPDKPSGVYYSSIRTYLNMFSGTFHRFYTTNGDDPDSLSTEFTGDPIIINYSKGSTVKLKAIAYDGTGAASNISETDYVFDSTPVSTDITNISNLIDSLAFTSVDVDTHIYPDKWKILFLALSNINTPTIKTSLSSDQVGNIRYRSNLFEDFVEESVPTLDLQINFVDVKDEVLTNTDNCYSGSPCFDKNDIDEILKKNNSDEYDSVIVIANMGNINLSYGGLTWSSERFSMLPYSESMAPNGYLYAHAGMIHEWIHQIEYWFPNFVSPEFITPGLHDNNQYGYYDNGGVEWLNWYKAYLSNNLTGGVSTGINKKWWRYTPTNNLKPTDDGSSSPPATQVNVDTTFTVANSLGTTNAVVLPEYTLITRSDGTLFEPSALTANDVNFSSISGLSNSASIEGAFQWGIVNHGLIFSKPITVIIYVGNNLNDQTLSIVRSVDGATNWTTDGIEGQSTCLVTNGYCQFQATKASYYVLARQVSSPSSNSSSNNSTSSHTDSSYCGNLPPSKSPHLFQIDVNSNTAKMYFTPLDDTSDFYISFSSKNKNAEEHGGHVTLTKEGVQSYIVYQLKPNTDYYFKIRGQNGCMPGSWSNILKIKTTSSKSINKKFYTNNVSKIVNTIQSAVKKITTNTTLKSNNKSKIILPNSSITPTIIKKNTQTSTIYPTSIPTQNNSPQNYSASNTNTSAPTSTHKKKCFLWWCW